MCNPSNQSHKNTHPLELEEYLAKQQQKYHTYVKKSPTMTRAQQTITAFVLLVTVSLTTLSCADSCPY
jgi:hypothetical protein